MLIIKNDFIDPEKNEIEIVERKGVGHPDTLADKLAEECSRVYSKYCMDNFGCVLHHNLDKLYIGAGLFKYEDGKIVKYENIRVDLNGRVSNTMNGKPINLEEIFIPTIKRYLKTVLPRLDVDNDLDININCTQNTKRDYWYSPRDINDVPDFKEVTAGDTALCVAHGGKTYCEMLAFEIEQMFYKYTDDGYMSPVYDNIGQDIKVMVSRIQNNVDVTMCIPVLKGFYKTDEEFDNIIRNYVVLVEKFITTIPNPKNYNVSVHINHKDDGTVDKYSLCIGSCIECGEEGIVGRGNNSQGIISAFRPHTVEAPCGKNVRYHTGRVVSFMANKAVERIYNELNIRCSLYGLTRNRNSLYEPYVFYLSVDGETDNNRINEIISQEFSPNYLEEILKPKRLF